MPTMDKLMEPPRKDLHVFYVLDTSFNWKYDVKVKDLPNALLYMRWKFGMEIFHNPPLLFSAINDLSPTLRRDANILRQMAEKGLLRELEQADEQRQVRAVYKARAWLEDELFMKEERAEYYAKALETVRYPVNTLPFTNKINTLNHLVEETAEILTTEAQRHQDGLTLKISILEFNSGCHWLTPYGPEDWEGKSYYEYLEAVNDRSELGAALLELNSKLSRDAFLNDRMSARFPLIVFLTDGHTTDNYTSALKEIRKNKLFQRLLPHLFQARKQQIMFHLMHILYL